MEFNVRLMSPTSGLAGVVIHRAISSASTAFVRLIQSAINLLAIVGEATWEKAVSTSKGRYPIAASTAVHTDSVC